MGLYDAMSELQLPYTLRWAERATEAILARCGMEHTKLYTQTCPLPQRLAHAAELAFQYRLARGSGPCELICRCLDQMRDEGCLRFEAEVPGRQPILPSQHTGPERRAR